MNKRKTALLCLLLVLTIGWSRSGDHVLAKDLDAKTTGGLKIETVTGTTGSSSSSSSSSSSTSSSSSSTDSSTDSSGDGISGGFNSSSSSSSNSVVKPNALGQYGENQRYLMPLLGLLVIGASLAYLIKKNKKPMSEEK